MTIISPKQPNSLKLGKTNVLCLRNIYGWRLAEAYVFTVIYFKFYILSAAYALLNGCTRMRFTRAKHIYNHRCNI